MKTIEIKKYFRFPNFYILGNSITYFMLNLYNIYIYE